MTELVEISDALLILGLSSSVTEEERALVEYCITSACGAVKQFLKYDPVYGERTEYYPAMSRNRTNATQIWEASDTEAYLREISGASSDELQVRHIPIRSVTSLKIDYDGRSGARSGSFGASTAKTEGTDFWPNYDMLDVDGNKVCNDGVIKSQGLWPDVSGSVKIVYYAGYKGVELRGQDTVLSASPIWEAAVDEVVRRVHKIYSRKKTRLGFQGPLTSENLGDYSYSRDSALFARLVGGTDLLPETREKLSTFENLGWQLSS